MKNLSIFLSVVSFCMISHVYGDIRIRNELKYQKKLWWTCHSGDNRLGPKVLQPNGQMRDNFNTNVWGTTRFMCTLRQGPQYKYYQNFTAFKQVSASDSGGLWDWRARENGIYLKVWGGKHMQGEVNMHWKYGWIKGQPWIIGAPE